MKFLLFFALFPFISPRNAPKSSSDEPKNPPPPISDIPSSPPQLGNCPNGILVRKEFRDMTPEEWKTFKEAMLAIYSKKSNKKKNESIVDYWTGTHLDHVPDAHNTVQFFPWHRVFVKKFEDEMRSLYPNLTIPYWDWSVDAKSPLKSPIFTPKFLGFVKLGPQGDCRWRVSYPKKHCLVRNYSPKHFSSFYDSKTMAKLVARKGKFSEFSDLMEGAPHGAAHIMIGGKGGDFSGMMSPNDPFFWLHHAYIDKLWNDWQHSDASSSTGKRFSEYNGKHRGKSVSSADLLRPWNIAVRDTFDIEKNFCYRYQPYSGRKVVNEQEEEKKGKIGNEQQEEEKKKLESPQEKHTLLPIIKEKEHFKGEKKKEEQFAERKETKLQNDVSNAATVTEKQQEQRNVPNDFKDAHSKEVEFHEKTEISSSDAKHSSRDKISPKLKNDNFEIQEESPLPRPIPQEWIEHHGFDLKAFRRNEQILLQLQREANGMEFNSCERNFSHSFFLVFISAFILMNVY